MIFVNIFIAKKWTENWFYALIVLALTILCSYLSAITVGKWSAKMKTLKLNWQ